MLRFNISLISEAGGELVALLADSGKCFTSSQERSSNSTVFNVFFLPFGVDRRTQNGAFGSMNPTYSLPEIARPVSKFKFQ